MANFQKADLKIAYEWTAGPNDNPNLRGEPDSSLFNRGQGYEVLYMLNKVLSATAPLSALHKGEDLIADDLPGDTRSQEKVAAWLRTRL
ncbi:hypothetical protein [Vreelandella stevensii]|uniref:hypothetical protein n=1 Tax=Vreelandella stevensii TaxID=502821 RepID=UPI000366212F|nr:hypothetical protein [Halomonas stevensii]